MGHKLHPFTVDKWWGLDPQTSDTAGTAGFSHLHTFYSDSLVPHHHLWDTAVTFTLQMRKLKHREFINSPRCPPHPPAPGWLCEVAEKEPGRLLSAVTSGGRSLHGDLEEKPTMDALTSSKAFQEWSLRGSRVLLIKKPNGVGAFVIFLFLLYMVKTFHFKKTESKQKWISKFREVQFLSMVINHLSRTDYCPQVETNKIFTLKPTCTEVSYFRPSGTPESEWHQQSGGGLFS